MSIYKPRVFGLAQCITVLPGGPGKKGKMKKALAIRTQLDLTQDMLAAYLGVSRSMLNMYEQGKRKLPTPALIKLGRLEMAYHAGMLAATNRAGDDATASIKNISEIVQNLQRRATACRRQAAELDRKLQLAQQESRHLHTVIQLPELLKGNNSTTANTAADKLWLEILEEKARKQSAQSAAEKFILQHRLLLLLNEAAAHEAAIDRLQPGRFNMAG